MFYSFGGYRGGGGGPPSLTRSFCQASSKRANTQSYQDALWQKQATPIPMDNTGITEKLKGHELAVDFIGTAFQISKAVERLVPRMHNVYHRRKTDAAVLVIVVHDSAEKNQTAGHGHRSSPLVGKVAG